MQELFIHARIFEATWVQWPYVADSWAEGKLPLRRNFQIFAGLLFATLSVARPASAATLHVPTDYPTIQACIDAAISGQDECLVATGTYHELINFLGKAITLRSSHGPQVTTIDGTGLNGSVVSSIDYTGPGKLLHGITIRGGRGTNYGGGMRVSGSSTVTNCSFNGNTATSWGGGMHAYGSPILINCLFSGNTAFAGGGFYNADHAPTVTNCTFSGNTASLGGGMLNDGSGPTLNNCVFWGNSSDEIKGLDTDRPIIRFSNVRGGLPGGAVDGGGNINLDPLFVRSPNPGPDGEWDGVDDDFGDLRLQPGSPCINSGDPDFVPQPGELDLDGHTRVLCGRVDMGAYEFGIGDFDCNQTINLADFFAWPACATDPVDPPQSPLSKGGSTGCEAFDFNADGDIDLADFAAFMLIASP